MSQTFHGSCLCGALRYRLSSPPRALSHCHCGQCRKAHRAAFASYGSVPVADLHIDRGADLLATFSSSPRRAPALLLALWLAAVLVKERRQVRRLGIGRPRQPGHALPSGETEACPGRVDGLLVPDRRSLATAGLKPAVADSVAAVFTVRIHFAACAVVFAC